MPFKCWSGLEKKKRKPKIIESETRNFSIKRIQNPYLIAMKSNARLTLNTLRLVLFILLLAQGSESLAQFNNQSIKSLEQTIDSIITATMKEQNIPGASYIIVNPEKTIIKKGFGFAKLEDPITKVNADSTIFRIGSITKTFTVAAILKLAEENRIDLDKDVNLYLKKIKVPDTFSKPITARHLITHSAGFDEIGGRRVFDPNDLIALDEFLKDKLIRVRPPGMITSYSTYAISLAGLLVEDITNQSLEAYLKSKFWDPMDMTMTSMVVPEEQATHTANGYELENGINASQPWEWYHTYPASEINSTVSDMGNYIKMLLNQGKFQKTQVLNPSGIQAMTQQQLSTHPEVDGFAAGFYKRSRFGIESIGHGGDMLGFSSWLTLLPEKGIGLYVVSHHEGGNLRTRVTDALLQFFAPQDKKESPEQHKSYTEPMDLSIFEGLYRWTTYCHNCEDSWIPPDNQITAIEGNLLEGFGRKFYPIAPLLFKSFDGQRTMGFVKDEEGEVRYMSLGNINTFERVE